jgi:hypothetical protein
MTKDEDIVPPFCSLRFACEYMAFGLTPYSQLAEKIKGQDLIRKLERGKNTYSKKMEEVAELLSAYIKVGHLTAKGYNRRYAEYGNNGNFNGMHKEEIKPNEQATIDCIHNFIDNNLNPNENEGYYEEWKDVEVDFHKLEEIWDIHKNKLTNYTNETKNSIAIAGGKGRGRKWDLIHKTVIDEYMKIKDEKIKIMNKDGTLTYKPITNMEAARRIESIIEKKHPDVLNSKSSCYLQPQTKQDKNGNSVNFGRCLIYAKWIGRYKNPGKYRNKK